ncbi:MAG: hypothetical protein GY832_33260 [Chloroflexi bacterium]|nr:hypothetical protein [Chloroflexota bacterium]
MPNDSVLPIQWRFWVRWVLASTLGGALGWIVDTILFSSLHIEWLLGAMSCIVPLVIQWLLLRKCVHRADSWMWVNVLYYVTTSTLHRLGFWNGFVSLLMPIVQMILWWLVLRQWGRRASLWAAVGTIGEYLILAAVARLSGVVSQPIDVGIIRILAHTVNQAAVSGMITGLVLVLVLQYPTAELLQWYGERSGMMTARHAPRKTRYYIKWGLVIIGAIGITLAILYAGVVIGLTLAWWGENDQWLWIIILAILGILWGSIFFALTRSDGRPIFTVPDQALPGANRDDLAKDAVDEEGSPTIDRERQRLDP